MKSFTAKFAVFTLFYLCQITFAGEYPGSITAYLGTTPTLDGMIQEAEYADAESFVGVKEWFSDTNPAALNSDDLSVKAWVKHDGASLYFAFDVTDNLIYGFDTDRWTHENNPDANEMNYRNGWSWWGDGVEIMMNSTFSWSGNETCAGDGRSWQVVCSTHKSTLGGLGVGGLMAGEPRTASAWGHYESWAQNGDMQVAVRLKDAAEGRGYVIEWRINPNPCMQINAADFVDLSQETRVGINFEIQDLDEKADGAGNWSNFHHIDYWAKVGSSSKTALKSFGTLVIKPEKIVSKVEKSEGRMSGYELRGNYPNPFNPSTTLRYALPQPAFVSLGIYNSQGQLVRSLVHNLQAAGSHQVVWDGRDSAGQLAPSGLYFCTMQSQNFFKTRKLLLLQ